MIINPYFGDLIRVQTVQWEFNYGLTPPESKQWAAAASLIGAAVSAAADKTEVIWLSGLVGPDDMESLTEMAEVHDPIHFPGVVMGWATKEEAIRALSMMENEGKQQTSKIVVKVEGATSLHFACCRYLVHRLHGKLVQHTPATESANFHQFEIKAEAFSGPPTIKEWKEFLAAEEARKAAEKEKTAE